MEEITIKVKIPQKLKAKLELALAKAVEEFVNREELKSKEEQYKRFDKLISKSKLTEEDAVKLGRKVNKSLHERYKKLYPELK